MEKKERPLCECSEYKCFEFGENSMETKDKNGRTVQIQKTTVAGCIRDIVVDKKDNRTFSEKQWDGDNPFKK